uniref:Uncharacterized protein n=1 Tax=Arundo donax TaxID=35708 RepID=A0A0A8YBZ9_ARUDO
MNTAIFVILWWSVSSFVKVFMSYCLLAA